MNTHERFIAAIMEQVPDPSPALAAYVKDYRASMPVYMAAELDKNALDEAAKRAVKLFSKLSPAEQQLLWTIQKGL